jgi:hypothetical protein
MESPIRKGHLLFTLGFILCQFSWANMASSATISQFTISPTTISLPDQDPDLVPEVQVLTDLLVNFSIRNLYGNENWTLEVYSDGDLLSGGDRIPIENTRWTVTGTGNPPGNFFNGSLNRGLYILAGQGPGRNNGRVNMTCVFRFYLKNSWSYSIGNYTRLITLRLTVPGQVMTRTFTLSLLLSGRAKLEMGLTAMSFPDADPDTVSSIPSNVNPMPVMSSTRTSSNLTTQLSCLAAGDLVSGSDSIPIQKITWQAAGSGYVPGTMSKGSGQTSGNWMGSGRRSGTFSYFLANSWSYPVGQYSTTLTYTLTAP